MRKSEKKEKLYSILKNGCDKRYMMGKVICNCEDAGTCPNAEICLGRAGIFTPEEAAEINLNMMEKKVWERRDR